MHFHGAHLAAHAEEEKKRLQNEEEEMTTYNQEDLQGDWEFKIMRSASPVFKNQNTFAALVEEEAQAGWELLEKLDNQRVRFKRNVSARRKDQYLPPDYDPYRTQYGGNTNAVVAMLVAFLVMGVGVGVYVLQSVSSTGGAETPIRSVVIWLIPMFLVFGGIFAAIKAQR